MTDLLVGLNLDGFHLRGNLCQQFLAGLGDHLLKPDDIALSSFRLRDACSIFTGHPSFAQHFHYLFVMSPLEHAIQDCRLCAARFAATATAHEPRPVTWFRPDARILVVGQAPGMRVHLSGRPFSDRSGDRLREWMEMDESVFYDRDRVAIVPMAFCFPGYNASGSDLPPPRLCAQTWRARVMAELRPRLTLLIGGHAIRWHLGLRDVSGAVASWRDHAPGIFPLPHPSWRNTAWLRRNPWFESDLLPDLRAAIRVELARND